MTSSARGLGTSPLGSGAYGWGMPAVPAIPGGVVYQGNDGYRYGSRKISRAVGSVGQYVYNDKGRAEGQPDVEHLVTIAALMVRNSSVVQGLGQRFYEARYVTPNLQQEQEANVNEAFKSLVDKGLIRIDSVKVEPNSGMPAVTRIRITDLTTGLPMAELTI